MTKSTEASASVVCSALPSIMEKFANCPRYCSPASRISRLGSTPITRLPFCSTTSASNPGPQPISAMTCSGFSPHLAAAPDRLQASNEDDIWRNPARGQRTEPRDRELTQTLVYLIVRNGAQTHLEAAAGRCHSHSDPADSPWTREHVRCSRGGRWLSPVCPTRLQGPGPGAWPSLAARIGIGRPYLIARRIWLRAAIPAGGRGSALQGPPRRYGDVRTPVPSAAQESFAATSLTDTPSKVVPV